MAHTMHINNACYVLVPGASNTAQNANMLQLAGARITATADHTNTDILTSRLHGEIPIDYMGQTLIDYIGGTLHLLHTQQTNKQHF